MPETVLYPSNAIKMNYEIQTCDDKLNINVSFNWSFKHEFKLIKISLSLLMPPQKQKNYERNLPFSYFFNRVWIFLYHSIEKFWIDFSIPADSTPLWKKNESAIFFKKEMTFLLVYVKLIYIILENFMKFRPGIFELSSQKKRTIVVKKIPKNNNKVFRWRWKTLIIWNVHNCIQLINYRGYLLYNKMHLCASLYKYLKWRISMNIFSIFNSIFRLFNHQNKS